MAGYTYSSKTISAWPWDAQAVTYRQMYENETHNVKIWKKRYEDLARKHQGSEQ